MRFSHDPAARRRLAALLAAAALALIVGAVVGSSTGGGGGQAGHGASGAAREGGGPLGDEGDAARAAGREAVARLSLRQQVGQLLVSSFDGPAMPDYIRRRLQARETAGVILFGRNGGDAAHWRELTDALQRAADGRALVMVDQEGGDIRTVGYAGPPVSQPLQGGPAEVRRLAQAAGRELRTAGINVNLAPVADVSEPGSVMASRAFPGGGAAVAARTKAAVRGLGEARVAATAKHFPGLGGSAVNTDDAPATVPGGLDDDLLPYRSAIAAGVPLVMLSHALYRDADSHAIASQSKPIATGLLRDELGFSGVAVTDSMEAQAVLARSDVATAAERSVRAGADLILMTGSASWNDVFPRLLATARQDPVFRERVRESAARALALSARVR